MHGDYALLYRTTDQFLVHGWFLKLLLTLLSLRKTVVAFVKLEN